MPPRWAVIDYRGAFSFATSPEAVWAAIQRVDTFEQSWGWLSEFRLEGDGLQPGAVLVGVVSPPLPYRMRLRVVVEDAEPARRVDAAVHGDLEGRARLLLEPEGSGTRATVTWTIEMMQRPMRLAARLGYPLLRWGHDRVVDATVSGFRHRLDNDA
ncbi:MAG TPA: SRPBCC family protein [Acidimicrobiales bacterium]